jgi:hypothetical protein
MKSVGKREWEKNLIAVGILGALFLVIAFLLWRPALVLGIDRDALSRSLAGEVGLLSGECTRSRDGSWRCSVRDSSGGGGQYRVVTHSLGCWHAVRVGRPSVEGGSPRTASGCIGLLDELLSGGGGNRNGQGGYGQGGD